MQAARMRDAQQTVVENEAGQVSPSCSGGPVERKRRHDLH